jgi:hypothetical protein
MLPACRTADETFAMPQFALTRSDIDAFMDALRGFHTALRACFTRQEPRDQCFHYMVGPCRALARKSIDPLALQMEGGNVRARQRLVSDTLWDEAAMRETYQRLVHDEMGEPDGVLLIDETGCAKKGQASVGGPANTAALWGRSSPVKSGCLRPMRRARAMPGSTTGCSCPSRG